MLTPEFKEAIRLLIKYAISNLNKYSPENIFKAKKVLKIQNHRDFLLGHIIGEIQGQYRQQFFVTNKRNMTTDEENEGDDIVTSFLNDLETAVVRLE